MRARRCLANFLCLVVCLLLVANTAFSSRLAAAASAQQQAPAAAMLAGTSNIAAGDAHTCVLTAGGGVKCWGWNGAGQLGDGTTEVRLTPVDVRGFTSGVQAVAAGGIHTCALTTDGGVKCWGHNYSGQLGDGTFADQLMPVDVSGLTSGVQAISAGDEYTCALTTDGGVKCWGANYSGQLGDGTTDDRPTPVDVIGLTSGVTAIAAGQFHTCAVTTLGSVKCWGSNRVGQLGDGTTNARLTPVDVIGLPSGVQAVAVGGEHTCVLTTGGGVKCWGANGAGQLGNGTTEIRLAPVDVSGLSSGVRAIAAGGIHTCALTTGGGVKCWGWGGSSAPVDMIGLTSGVAAISGGSGVHTCVVITGGGARCWGFNDYGQLGDGTTTGTWTPVNVIGLTSGVKSTTIGNEHTCALTTGGGVKCWGNNYTGQLGVNPGWLPVDVNFGRRFLPIIFGP